MTTAEAPRSDARLTDGAAVPRTDAGDATTRSVRHRYFGIALAASGLIILAGIVIHDLIRGEGAIILGPKSYTAIAFTVILTFVALFLDTRARNRLLESQKHELHRLAEELRTTVARVERVNADLEVAREHAVAANSAKTTFLANMSHEIRTPLNGVLGYAQILARDATLTERQRNMIETISDSGAQLLAILNDILDLSKIEAGAVELRPTDFDLVDLLNGVMATYGSRADEKGIRLAVEGPGLGPLAVNGDQVRLRQVLTNLVDNAIRFTDRGEVVLHCRSHENDHYRFAVRDTGIGIPPSLHEAIFEPFRQGDEGAKRGGTGLGLAICRRQVELMGGRLTLTSASREGSTFSFELVLPRATMAVRERDSRARRVLRLADGHAIAVAIAIGDPLNRDVLAGMLRSIGCTLVAVERPDALLAGSRFDVVFVDVPERVTDATALVARLSAQGSGPAPRIVGIGPENERDARLARASGFADVLSLPLRAEALYASLELNLKAHFESSGVAVDAAPERALAAATTKLPDDLRRRLVDAARTASITELRNAIGDLAALGEEEAILSRRLAALARNYDMDGILGVLGADDDVQT